MDLNFNQCLTLLIIAFIFALIVTRALMAVVNRGFLVVDYAKEQLYGKGKSGGRFNLLQEIFGFVKPAIQQKVTEWLGGKKP